jgi:hypothetical protein
MPPSSSSSSSSSSTKKSSLGRFSLSKKWNSVIGGGNKGKNSNNNNYNKVGVVLPSTQSSSSSSSSNGKDAKDVTKTKTVLDESSTSSTPAADYEAAIISDTSEEEDDDSSEDENVDYGYGDATPDSELVAAQAAAAAAQAVDKVSSLPRRLSSRMAATNKSNGRRRGSISRQQPLDLNDVGENGDDENLPFHPKRQPRRSSIKGAGCPTARANRRASIGVCASFAPQQVVEIQLPGNRRVLKRRSSITFNEDVNVRKIQPTIKIKGADKKELWFQDQEYTSIKKKTKALLEKVDSNGIVNGKKYCTRGLEKYMQDPTERAREKYGSWDSVLIEQDNQRKTNNYSSGDENIARLYKYTSTMSTIQATQRAAFDAEEVASFYDNQPTPAVVETTTTATTDDDHRPSRARRRASVA